MTDDRLRGGALAPGWLLDLVCAAAVVLANPVLYSLGDGITGTYSLDATAYASLGRALAEEGKLFLESWGHVDRGVILPPLLPALIALGGIVSEDLLRVGATISGIAALVAGLGCYLLAARLSNRLVAVVAAVAIQTGEFFFKFAFMSITESLFTAVCVWTLVLLWRYLATGRGGWGFALGVACALAFLSRKAGSFVSGFCLLWIAIDWFWRSRSGLGALGRRLLPVLTGLLLLLGPYALALYAQTGQHPLQPRFRMGKYTVTTDDPEVIAEIRQIRDSRDEDDYSSIYRARRQMRKLLPDASETYEALMPPPWKEKSDSVPMRVLLEALDDPLAVPGRLLTNVSHLREVLGDPLIVLFLLCSASPLIQRAFRPIPPERLLVAGFVWSYLAAVSIVTDLVSRYAVVVAPFVTLQVAIELYALASAASRRRIAAAAVVAAILAAAAAAAPAHFDAVRLSYKWRGSAYSELQQHIRPGEPVFTLLPYDAFALGASYRVLPDAPLEQVAHYARKTGVRWVLISLRLKNLEQISMYKHRWYFLRSDQRDAIFAPTLIKRAEARKGRTALYRISGS